MTLRTSVRSARTTQKRIKARVDWIIATFGPGEYETTNKMAETGSAHALSLRDAEPGLEFLDQFYWQAYLRLHNDKPLTMGGIGPLPWSYIRDYGHYLGQYDHDLEYFHDAIRVCVKRSSIG